MTKETAIIEGTAREKQRLVDPSFVARPARPTNLGMERDPQTDCELLPWSKALQMEGVILPLIDSLKASVDLLAEAGNTLPKDSGVDRALERFRRVIAAGERAAEGLHIGMSSYKILDYIMHLIL